MPLQHMYLAAMCDHRAFCVVDGQNVDALFLFSLSITSKNEHENERKRGRKKKTTI